MNKYEKHLQEIIESLKVLKPYRIILIGSLADGSQRVDSDIDLVVILDKNTESNSYKEKMAYRLQVRRCIYDISKQIPIDLIVYTKGEFQRISKLRTSFYNEITSTGKILYEKAG